MSLLKPLYKLFGSIPDLDALIVGGNIKTNSFCPRKGEPSFEHVIRCYASAFRNEVDLGKESKWYHNQGTWFNFRHDININSGHVCRISSPTNNHIWHEDSMIRLKASLNDSNMICVWLRPIDYCVWTALAIHQSACVERLFFAFSQFPLAWKMIVGYLKIEALNPLNASCAISSHKIVDKFELDNGSHEFEGIEPMSVVGVWYDIPLQNVRTDVALTDINLKRRMETMIESTELYPNNKAIVESLLDYFTDKSKNLGNDRSQGKLMHSIGPHLIDFPYRLVYAAAALCITAPPSEYRLGAIPINSCVAALVDIDEVPPKVGSDYENHDIHFVFSDTSTNNDKLVTSKEYQSLMFISNRIVQWMHYDKIIHITTIDNDRECRISGEIFDIELCRLLLAGSCQKLIMNLNIAYVYRDLLFAMANTLIIQIEAHKDGTYKHYKKYVMLALIYAKMFHDQGNGGSKSDPFHDVNWKEDSNYYNGRTLEYRYDIMMNLRELLKYSNIDFKYRPLLYQWLLLEPYTEIIHEPLQPIASKVIADYRKALFNERKSTLSDKEYMDEYIQLMNLFHNKHAINPWKDVWDYVNAGIGNSKLGISSLMLLQAHSNIMDQNPKESKFSINGFRCYHYMKYPRIDFDSGIETLLSDMVLKRESKQIFSTSKRECGPRFIIPIPKERSNVDVFMSKKFCYDAIKIVESVLTKLRNNNLSSSSEELKMSSSSSPERNAPIPIYSPPSSIITKLTDVASQSTFVNDSQDIPNDSIENVDPNNDLWNIIIPETPKVINPLSSPPPPPPPSSSSSSTITTAPIIDSSPNKKSDDSKRSSPIKIPKKSISRKSPSRSKNTKEDEKETQLPSSPSSMPPLSFVNSQPSKLGPKMSQVELAQLLIAKKSAALNESIKASQSSQLSSSSSSSSSSSNSTRRRRRSPSPSPPKNNDNTKEKKARN